MTRIAKNPRGPRVKNLHTDEIQTNQPAPRIDGNGNLNTAPAIEAIDKPLNKEYVDELAFMEELVEVMVQEDTNENAENPVQVGCNGVFVQFFRGVPTIVKRKFVDCLIVKQNRVSTPEYINGGGERARSIKQTSAMKFPFTIISDKNPKGGEWLRRRVSEQF